LENKIHSVQNLLLGSETKNKANENIMDKMSFHSEERMLFYNWFQNEIFSARKLLESKNQENDRLRRETTQHQTIVNLTNKNIFLLLHFK